MPSQDELDRLASLLRIDRPSAAETAANEKSQEALRVLSQKISGIEAERSKPQKQLIEAAKYVLRLHDGRCGDHCFNTCEWCILREALAAAGGLS